MIKSRARLASPTWSISTKYAIYQTLSSKSSNPLMGISRVIYLKFVDLPGIIGERVFNISDKNKDGFLSFMEFCSTILKLNSSDTNIKMKLIFDIFDFDGDGILNNEDIKTVMVHLLNDSRIKLDRKKSNMFDDHETKVYVN
jgi:hypothetical protein